MVRLDLIFTLDLPWQLGADFFLRHLMDGDVASNTLGWRWVAGIQTRGKTYLAREDNIATFTEGRFEKVPGLASEAAAKDAPPNPDPAPLPEVPDAKPEGRWGLLLHPDDVDAGPLLSLGSDPSACAILDCTEEHSPWTMAEHVGAFRRAAARNQMPEGAEAQLLRSAEELEIWAEDQKLDMILAPYAPVGVTQDALAHYRAGERPVPLHEVRRPFDSVAWPKATKGFFKFKENIPDLIDRFVLTD